MDMEHDGKGRRTMSSREDPKVRKQARPLCKVSGLPDDLAVGRGKAKMGFKGSEDGNSGGLFGEESSPRMGHESSERANAPTWGEFDIEPINNFHQEAGEIASSQTQEISRQAQHAGGGRGRLRLGLGGGLGEKKAANYAWLASHLRAQQRLYNYEVEAYKTLATYERIHKEGGKIGLMEVFSGRGRLTSSAHRYGLNALQPIDTNEGFDLTTYEGKCITMHALSQFKPLLLVVAWPCTFWSIMNENSNYSNRPEELAALRQEERPLVNFSADLCSARNWGAGALLGRESIEVKTLVREEGGEAVLAPRHTRDDLSCWCLWSRRCRWVSYQDSSMVDQLHLHCQRAPTQDGLRSSRCMQGRLKDLAPRLQENTVKDWQMQFFVDS